MHLSLIIPVYNEEESLRPLFEAIRRAIAPLRRSWEVIFVDDGSTDGSLAVLRDLAAGDARHVRVIALRRNFGQTAAITAGVDHSRGDIIVLLDADLQNDPADIPRLLAKLDEGYDLVSGWRKNRKDNALTRTLPSILANGLISRVTGVHLHDYGCTLKAYRREALEGFRLYGEMHRFIPVLAQNSGHRILQVPVRHHPRRFGQTKYNISRTVRVFLDLITVKFLDSYLTRPMHVFGAGGLICMLAGFSSLFVTVLEKLVWNEDMTGNPLLLLSVMLTVIGVQFISMGLLGEMIARTYFESQGKTAYMIRKTLNLGPEPAERSRAA